MKRTGSLSFKILVFILLFNSFLQGQSSRVHDSLIVRAILDSNSLWDVEVDEVAKFGENDSGVIVLSIEESKLSYIPSIIGELKRLRGLFVLGNELDSLPQEIGELEALSTFDVSRNEIKYLPKEIGELKALHILLVWGNELKSLPKEIGELKALIQLFASGNELESLPEEICELDSLQEIYVRNNKLTSLPECIVNFPAWFYIYDPDGTYYMHPTIHVDGNMLCSLSTSIEEWLDANDPYWKNT